MVVRGGREVIWLRRVVFTFWVKHGSVCCRAYSSPRARRRARSCASRSRSRSGCGFLGRVFVGGVAASGVVMVGSMAGSAAMGVLGCGW